LLGVKTLQIGRQAGRIYSSGGGYMDDGQIDILKNALISISRLRQNTGEKQFRGLLSSLQASQRNIKHVSEFARSFDEEDGKFIRPYRRMMKIIGKDKLKKEKFLKSTLNFKPAQKGQRGGLKIFAAELCQERDKIAELLKKYNRLKSKKSKLSDSAINKLLAIERNIPKAIKEILSTTKSNKQGKTKPAYKKIAIKWMARYYPCTENTLLQIIREAP
jgi:hypothetical protein